MAIFRYKDNSIIDRIEIRAPEGELAQAVIIAREGVDCNALETLRLQLGAKDLSTLMDTEGDRAALQIRGFKDQKSLLVTLAGMGIDSGHAEREALAEDSKKLNFREKVRGKAQFLSAIFYDLGNVAFLASGIQRGRHNPGGKWTSNDKSEMLVGAAFSVGDILMTGFGDHKGDEELSAAAQGLKRHLHQKGIAIPKGNELNPDTLHESGAMKATDRWMRKHVIDIKCLSEFTGGLFTMHSALKPGNRNNSKLVAGFLISTGWLACLLLDKTPAERMLEGQKEPPASLGDAMIDNPRGLITRPLAMSNNVANLWGALNPKTGEKARYAKEVVDARASGNAAQIAYATAKQHDYAWNVMSACAFLVGHVLFGLSGTKRPTETDDDKTMMNDLVLMSANILAKQPEEVQKITIGETADYVSKLAHVHMTRDQVEEAIRTKMHSLCSSTWVARVQGAADAQLQVN